MGAAPPRVLHDTIKAPHALSQELGEWLSRASPADRDRFQGVIDAIRPLSAEAMRRQEDAEAAATTRRAHQAQRPPVPTAASHGWTYTTTRHAVPRGSGPPSTTAASQEQQQQQSATWGSAASGSGRPPSAAGARPPPQHARDHELAAFTAAMAARGSAGSVQLPGRGPACPPAPDVTTYQESFNLRNDFPDLYAQALADTKADAVPNYTLISEWGESLRAGADEAHKLHTRTTYGITNDEVVKQQTGFEQVKEREHFKWVQRQKTYYSDLFKDPSAMDAVFAAASDAQKREIVAALRQAHAVAEPEKFKSHSQATHGPMARTEDPSLTALLTESVKARTLGVSRPPPAARRTANEASTSYGDGGARPRTAGAPRPGTAELKPSLVDLNSQQHSAACGSGGGRARPATADASLGARAARAKAASAAAALKQQHKALDQDTFISKVPLKWSVNATAGPQLSTYIETYGGSKYGAGRARPSSALFRNQTVRYKEVTCPIGSVNPHTAMAPFRSAYPVPEGFTQALDFPQSEGDATMSTTYRMGYAPRDQDAVVRTLKAAAQLTEISHKALLRSTLPLGRNGVNIMGPGEWVSEAKEEFVKHKMDVQGDYERAQALKKLFNGPTASVGKVATLVPSRA